MTTVTFHTEGNRITGFEVQGHSGFATEGEDIVCAAVTSAVRLVECSINDVLGLEAAVKVREKDAYISLNLPAKLGQTAESTCQKSLTGALGSLSQLGGEVERDGRVLFTNLHCGFQPQHVVDSAFSQTHSAGDCGTDDIFSLAGISAVALNFKANDTAALGMKGYSGHQALIAPI